MVRAGAGPRSLRPPHRGCLWRRFTKALPSASGDAAGTSNALRMKLRARYMRRKTGELGSAVKAAAKGDAARLAAARAAGGGLNAYHLSLTLGAPPGAQAPLGVYANLDPSPAGALLALGARAEERSALVVTRDRRLTVLRDFCGLEGRER